jgi:two-component system, OmpR family, response regulator VanR
MGIQILVAEDDEHIRNTVQTFSLQAVYQVDTCSDGDEALEQFYDKGISLLF